MKVHASNGITVKSIKKAHRQEKFIVIRGKVLQPRYSAQGILHLSEMYRQRKWLVKQESCMTANEVNKLIEMNLLTDKYW